MEYFLIHIPRSPYVGSCCMNMNHQYSAPYKLQYAGHCLENLTKNGLYEYESPVDKIGKHYGRIPYHGCKTLLYTNFAVTIAYLIGAS